MKISEVATKVVRASDPKPKLSKPVTGREQPHPYTGMLVGSKNNENKPPMKGIRDSIHDFLDYCKSKGFTTVDQIQSNYDSCAVKFENLTGVDLTEQEMADFGGKFIDKDFMDLVKLMKGRGQGSAQELASNLLSFLSFAMNDPKFGKLPLSKFGDNIKIVYNQYNANQSFDQHEKDKEEFKKLDTPPAMRQPEESLEYNSLEESVGEFITEEEFDQLAEKQDACYHKVKSRYKVWPSAYASGALVKCRKVGAKNWGNSSKKKKSKKK